MNHIKPSEQLMDELGRSVFKAHHVIAYNEIRQCLMVWRADTMHLARIVIRNLSVFDSLHFVTIVYHGNNPFTYLTPVYANAMYITESTNNTWYYPRFETLVGRGHL